MFSTGNSVFVAKSKSAVLKGSVQKLNICLKAIRGKSLEEAINIVSALKKDLALPIRKTLLNVASNAEQNGYYNLSEVFLKNISAEKAVTLRRYHPRARGKIFRVNKHYSKLYIEVYTKEVGR